MRMEGLELATWIEPGDTSTSIVIHPDINRQIQHGATALTSFENVVYSKPLSSQGGRCLHIDIHAPQSPDRKPLVVFLAGGGFVTADNKSALNLRTYVAEAGFVVASIEYRTVSDGATYREGLADLKSAIRFLRKHAETYGIDPEKIAVWGESAGGYLASLAAVTNDDGSFDIGDNLDQSSRVIAVVDKFGPSDVSKADADFNPEKRLRVPERRVRYVNGFSPDGGLQDPASNPITHVKESDVKYLLLHGSKDGLISPSQTLLLHNALLAAGVNSKRYLLEGANHGDLSFLGEKDSGLPWSSADTMDIIVDFLRETLSHQE